MANDDPHGPYPPYSMTLVGLRIFESVARNAGFSRAAEELNVSQPYVSNQIQELESRLHVALFRRVGRRVYLTEPGTLLNRHVRELLPQLLAIERDIAELRVVIVGRLDLATVIIAAEYLLPRVLADFRVQYPDVALNLRVFNSKGVEEAVADGRYELGLTLSHCPSENLKAEKLGADELVAVVSKQHRLAGETTVKAEDLANEILLMREPTSGTRLFLESRFSAAGIRLVYGMELNDNQVIKAFVEYNLGIAILSRRTVAAEVSSGRMSSLKIQGLELQRDFYLVSRKNHSLSPPARAFRSILMGVSPVS